ncbi:unnamed protein product, partial [Owenia fusiformis]
ACGDSLVGDSGLLQYPVPFGYQNDEICIWTITVSTGKTIQVSFSVFDLEPDQDCYFDFLQIYDGPSETSPYIGRFCGDFLLVDSPVEGRGFSSTTNQLFLRFESDEIATFDGFELSWTASDCGGSQIGTRGSLRYPLVIGTDYSTLENCAWLITVSTNEEIQLLFSRFDINCQVGLDFLRIYDGPSVTSSLIGEYCGTQAPIGIRSTTNTLYLWFSSDIFGVAKGFEVTLFSSCSSVVRKTNTFARFYLTNAHNQMDGLAYSTLSMGFYFKRDDVAFLDVADFFVSFSNFMWREADAVKYYITDRGDCVVIDAINVAYSNDWCFYDAFEKTMEAIRDYLTQLKLAGEEAKTFEDQATVEFVKKMTSRHEEILKQFSVYLENSRRAERTKSEAWLFNKLNKWLKFDDIIDDDMIIKNI